MSRTIFTEVDAARLRSKLGPSLADDVPPPDKYTDRLMKYLPPDIIGAYSAIQALAAASAHDNSNAGKAIAASWTVFAVIGLATPFYLWRVAKIDKPLQIAISWAAFLVWAIAYPGLPFGPIVDPIYSAVALGLFTFLIPIVEV